MASDVPNLPVFLRLEGISCLVVGGRRPACDKVAALVPTGAKVTVVAANVDPRMDDFDVTVEHRHYQHGEAASYGLVIAATGLKDVDYVVAADAKAAGVLFNVVDDRSASAFIMPAIYRKGDLTVAVSTNGNSPAFATFVRDEVGRLVGENVDELLATVGDIRTRLKSLGETSEGRDWRGLINATITSYKSDGIAAARETAASYSASWMHPSTDS